MDQGGNLSQSQKLQLSRTTAREETMHQSVIKPMATVNEKVTCLWTSGHTGRIVSR